MNKRLVYIILFLLSFVAVIPSIFKYVNGNFQSKEFVGSNPVESFIKFQILRYPKSWQQVEQKLSMEIPDSSVHTSMIVSLEQNKNINELDIALITDLQLSDVQKQNMRSTICSTLGTDAQTLDKIVVKVGSLNPRVTNAQTISVKCD